MSKAEQYAKEAAEAGARAKKLKGKWSGVGSAAAFTQGATDSFTGPLRSLLAASVADEDVLRYQESRQQEHSFAEGAGAVTGFMLGALSGTGLPGVLVGAGKKVAGAVGKQIGVEAGKKGLGQVARRAGASAVGVGLEGAGIALSEATGKSAIDRALGVPGSGMQIAESVGAGLQLGAGAGVLGVLLPSAAGWLFRKGFGKRIGKVSEAMAKKAEAAKKEEALLAQVEAVEARSVITPQGLGEYEAIMGRAGGEFIRRGPKRLGEPALRKGRFGTDPELVKVMRAREAGDSAIEKALWDSLGDIGEKARDATAEGAQGMASLARGGAFGWMFQKIFMPSVTLANRLIFKGISKTPGARFAMSSSLAAGRPSLRKWGIKGGKMTQLPVRYDKYVDGGREFIRAMKVPPIQYLTNEEFQQIAGEIRGLDTAAMEMSIRAGMAAKGVPQEAATAVVEGYSNMLNYIQGQLPQFHPPKWISHERTPVVPTRDRVSLSRTLRSVLVPSSAIADFLNGDLTKEAADAWWQTQPQWAQLFADEIARSVDIATAYGRKFAPKEKEQLGLVTDQTGLMLGRTRQYNLTQRLQATYQADGMQVPPAQVGGPKPPGDPGAAAGINQTMTGPSASLGQRLTER